MIIVATKMIKIDLAQSKNDDFLQEIHPNIWLMNNHKWAYFVWHNFKYNNSYIPPTLLHLDYHWDGVNDFHNDNEAIKKLIKTDKPDALCQMIKENKLIKADSFIAPAVIKKLINELHFYCFQRDDDPGLDNLLLQNNKAKQYIHKNIDLLINAVGDKQIIFDLDLDIFNKSENAFNPNIWEEKEIVNFLYKLSKIIKNAKVITVAISYVYSGYSLENVRNLIEISIPLMIKYNN